MKLNEAGPGPDLPREESPAAPQAASRPATHAKDKAAHGAPPDDNATADIRRLVFRLYDRAVELVILGVIPLMLVALGFAFVQALLSTVATFPLIHDATPDEAALRILVEHVLDVVILIELFNTFMEYARTRHIRLANLLDVTIVFAMREILIQLYAQVFSPEDLLTLCVLVIVLVIARSIAAGFSRE
jgi:uncharacterized membrane protein (DUF373 family)